MPRHIHHIDSSVEIHRETFDELLDTIELPTEIKSLTVNQRNNTLFIESEPDTDNLSPYTPTCQLRATVREKRVKPEREINEPPWSDPEDDEPQGELVEIVCFKGDCETVLQNTALRGPMFDILTTIAEHAESGDLSAIYCDGEQLASLLISDGCRRDSSAEVVCQELEDEDESSDVNWTENDYIKS